MVSQNRMILFKSLLFVAVAPGAVLYLIPYLLVSSGWDLHPLNLGLFRFLGFPLVGAGSAGLLWCAWNFATVGRGTPAPIDPPRELVIHGLYRYVRNPMYVSGGIVLLGETLCFQSVTPSAYLLLFWLAAHLLVVFYEEPHLKQTFGPAYEAYCRAVPRWIPRFPDMKKNS